MANLLLNETREFDERTSCVDKGPGWSTRKLVAIAMSIGTAGLELVRVPESAVPLELIGMIAVQRSLLILHCELEDCDFERASSVSREVLKPLSLLQRAEQIVKGFADPIPYEVDDRSYKRRPGRRDLARSCLDLNFAHMLLADINGVDPVEAHRKAMGI